jgi:hypothetical protein
VSDNLDSYLDLPEDPELQLVAFEREARKTMWNSISNISIRALNQKTADSDIRESKANYVSRVMAFHDAHDFSMLKKPNLWRNGEHFDNEFESFLDEATYWTTQIEVRHANRLRTISTILRLTPEIRQQLHSYITKIREAVSSGDSNKEEGSDHWKT